MFSDHGDFEIIVADDVIRVKAWGAYNEGGTRKFCHSLEQEVAKLDGKAFAMISNLLELEGATPESWELAKQHNDWLATTSIAAKAIITKGSLISTLAQRSNDTSMNDKTRIFDDIKQAESWVAEIMARKLIEGV